MKASVKIVSASGQISLGKEFAGRKVLVEETAAGVWMVRTATVVSDNECWLHTPAVAGGLSRALAWAAENPVFRCRHASNRVNALPACSSSW